MKVDIKYKNSIVTELTDVSQIKLNTSSKYLSAPVVFDVQEAGVDTSDATADASKILSGYTAYISDESKATGTIQTWSGSYYIPFDGLCFTANAAGSQIALYGIGAPFWSGSYSLDGLMWSPYTLNQWITFENIGDCVYFKGNISGDFDSSNYLNFKMSGSISAFGNCNSLYTDTNYNALTTLVYKRCFYALFDECSLLTLAPRLPAIALSENCYLYMFHNCTSLTTSPKLPATILARNCYTRMFEACSSLVTPPKLPATTLVADCYLNMFKGCGLQVESSATATATNIWKFPSSDAFENEITQNGVFWNCSGTRTDGDKLIPVVRQQKIYYTQNQPV